MQAAKEKHSFPYTFLAPFQALSPQVIPRLPLLNSTAVTLQTGPCWFGFSAKSRQLAVLSVVDGVCFCAVLAHRVAPEISTGHQGQNPDLAPEGHGGPCTRGGGVCWNDPSGSGVEMSRDRERLREHTSEWRSSRAAYWTGRAGRKT